jgi:hypothetical protein
LAADSTGDDLSVGQTNHAEDGTELIGKNTNDHLFGNDYVLQATAPRDLFFTDAIRGVAEGDSNGVFGTSGQASGSAGVLGRISSANGAGVRGENDQGPAVQGVSAPTDSAFQGVGVRGEGQDPDNLGLEVVGVEGISAHSIGVRGLSGPVTGLATGSIGVLGAAESANGRGVRGESDAGVGVDGWAANGIGVSAGSAGSIALNAVSARDRAGVFQSGDPVRDGTSRGGLAQLRLVPAHDGLLPTNGQLGDLWAHFSQTPRENRQKFVSLWLCVNDDPVEWEQIALSGVRSLGGDPAS